MFKTHTHTLHTFTDKLFKKLKPKHLKQNTLKQTSADLNNACCVCLNIRLNFFFSGGNRTDVVQGMFTI